MRTIVTLPDEQAGRLDQLAAREGISRAEVIRRAVDRLLADAGRAPAQPGTFGLWAPRREDARAYEDRVRKEWSVRERRPRHQHPG